MFPVDLHSHSIHSPDGHLLVAELFRRAKRRSLKALVVTDHNTTRHFDDAEAAAKKARIETLEGIELTANWLGAPVHILGYANPFDRRILKKGLAATIAGYNQLAEQKITKLVELGLPQLELNSLRKLSKGEYVANHQIARALAKKLGVSYEQTYRYIKEGGPADLPYGEWAMTPLEAAKLVKKAGGVAVLAHPGSTQKNLGDRASVFDLINQLKGQIVGVEVSHIYNKRSRVPRLAQFVKKLGLLATGGSDWHGSEFTGYYQLGDWGCSYVVFAALKEKLARG